MAGPKITFSVRKTGGWARFGALIDPAKANGRMRSNMRNATSHNAKLFAKQIRKVIQGGVAPANAALTIFIKKSSKPLAGPDALLFKAIAHKTLDPYTAEVGVKKGDASVNSAMVAHEGARIPVTPSMRAMFAYLADASDGNRSPGVLTGRAAELWRKRPGGWKALKKSTTHIVVPGRPFIKLAIEDKSARKTAARNWSYAYAAALAGKVWKAQR